jgi:hypothetical protein
MFPIPFDGLQIAASGRFTALSRPLIAKGFSLSLTAVSSAPVRSNQLCGVAGSLWTRPRFLIGALNRLLA